MTQRTIGVPDIVTIDNDNDDANQPSLVPDIHQLRKLVAALEFMLEDARLHDERQLELDAEWLRRLDPMIHIHNRGNDYDVYLSPYDDDHIVIKRDRKRPGDGFTVGFDTTTYHRVVSLALAFRP